MSFIWIVSVCNNIGMKIMVYFQPSSAISNGRCWYILSCTCYSFLWNFINQTFRPSIVQSLWLSLLSILYSPAHLTIWKFVRFKEVFFAHIYTSSIILDYKMVVSTSLAGLSLLLGQLIFGNSSVINLQINTFWEEKETKF